MEEDHELNYSSLVSDLRKSHRSGVIRSYDARVKELKQLHLLMEEHEEEIYNAVYKDLHKCKQEANVMEMLQVRIELGNAINDLHKWMKAERVGGDLINKMNTCELRCEPLGVILMIAPWNYPIQLMLLPLVGALAAGNCVVIKPSEVSPNASDVLGRLITQYLSPNVVQVVSGGIPESTALLRERFDLIFYTGSTFVGKIVMKAAAQHLTPVVLELGGKCPAIIDTTCNMDVIAQRITWAKFANCGQTCLAVDYVLCIGACQDVFVEAMKKAIEKFYGEDQKQSDSYGRIINQRHFQRLAKLIDESKVAYGNVKDEDDLYISPTVLKNVARDDAVMQDEIFGPLLPIVNVETLDEAIDFVNDGEKPLSLYVFSNDYQLTERVTAETSSGGVCINDAVVHAGVPNLPFGGVGHSGMGRYHGKSSFETFSNKKSYMYKNQMLESANAIRYPPYDSEWTLWKLAEWMLTPKVKH